MTALRLDAEAVDDPEDRQRFAGDVDHLARIVDEVIRTARRPVREGVGAHADLGAVVAQRIAFWTPLAEDDGRAIESVVPTGPVLVRGSEADVGAAVDALIQNVFAHTPDATGMRIEVTARTEGGGVLVVADDGPGFPPSDSPDGGSGARSVRHIDRPGSGYRAPHRRGVRWRDADRPDATCPAHGGGAADRRRARAGRRSGLGHHR